jgi:hypothetical protein
MGASLAAAALALVTLLGALFLPLIPRCQTSTSGPCHVRLASLASLAGHVEPAIWVYIALMAGLTLAGALGGLLDAARGDRRGLALLGISTTLALAGCALGALGAFGSLYLPSMVALLIAAAAAYARRRPQPQTPRPTSGQG